MKLIENKKGLTLVEVLVAVALFSVVTMIAINVMINVAKIEKRSALETAIYEDLRFVMQRLTDEVSNGTIDYEEYYNVLVIQDGEATKEYGVNYGVYGSRFFDPGKRYKDGSSPINPRDLGVECSYENDEGVCEVIYTLSTDLNTGQNPFTGDETLSDAFCDNGEGQCGPDAGMVDELYLLDESGTKKTILGLKKINGSGTEDYALGIVELEGEDTDQNGIVDTFTCMDKYFCDNPQSDDWEEPFDVGNVAGSEFVPISPLRSSIKDLKFVIFPLEDPYKAYAEDEAQQHPVVSILLTIGLSEEAAASYPGDFEDLTVQATVTAGALARIDSYPPLDDIETGWIDDVLAPQFDTPY